MTRPRPRTRRRYLPEDAPTAAEAERDLAEDEADREWFEQYRARRRAADDELRDGLAGWGEK